MAQTHLFRGAGGGLELLERRRLLSCTVGADGVLEIRGTDGADTVELKLAMRDVNGVCRRVLVASWDLNYQLSAGGQPLPKAQLDMGTVEVPLDTLSGVRVLGLGGNDVLFVDKRGMGYDGAQMLALGFDLPVTLAGGAGDDTLVGGQAADVLAGGAGADWIDGGEGEWPAGQWPSMDHWLNESAPPLDGARVLVGADTVGGMRGAVGPNARGAWVEHDAPARPTVGVAPDAPAALAPTGSVTPAAPSVVGPFSTAPVARHPIDDLAGAPANVW